MRYLKTYKIFESSNIEYLRNDINDILCDECELLIDEMLAYEYESMIDSIPTNDNIDII